MWQLGSAEVEVTFREGYSRLLCVSTMQMMILLAFDTKHASKSGTLSTDQLIAITGLSTCGAIELLLMFVPSVQGSIWT